MCYIELRVGKLKHIKGVRAIVARRSTVLWGYPVVQPNRFHYMHYPRSVFDGHCLEAVNPVTSLCEQLPGSGLSGNGFFSVGGCLGDQHEQITTLTLFGGLVQGRVNSLEVKLDLPELPEDLDNNLLETRIPKSVSSYSNDLVDEGFKSQEESLTSSTNGEDVAYDVSFDSVFQSDYDASIYETCLTEKISQYYTWETLGLGPGPRTKPYITEAGPEAFDHLNKAMLKDLTTAFPSVRVSTRQEISQGELVKEILNVMIAVPSVNFMLDLWFKMFLTHKALEGKVIDLSKALWKERDMYFPASSCQVIHFTGPSRMEAWTCIYNIHSSYWIWIL